MSKTYRRTTRTRPSRHYLQMRRNPDDTGRNIALLALVGAVGYGLYSWWLKPEPEVPVEEGEWASANVELARKGFSVIIREPITGDWRPANAELARIPFSVTIKEPIVGDWRPANTELARQPFMVSIKAPVETYILNIKVNPLETGYVIRDPTKDRYVFGEIVTLAAYPIWTYEFNYWDCDGEWLDSANPINFMVLADHTLTANFRTRGGY